MKILISFFLLFSFVFSNDSLDLLLKNIKQSNQQTSLENQQRLDNFINKKNEQTKLLKNIKKELQQEQQKTKQLQNTITKNEDELAKLEEKLRIKSGNFGEIFGVVRQISGDFQSQIELSHTSATINDREPFLNKLSNSKALPNIEELEKLWYLISQDTIHKGKIETNTLEVITLNGSSTQQKVTNIGGFIAFSGNSIVNYDNQLKKYVQIPNNSSYINSYVESFNQNSQIVQTIIDPTRGSLLSLFNEKPDLGERIEQGGIVGYTILALGALGVLLAIYKLIYLLIINNKVQKQLKSLDSIELNNPLGRVINSFNNFKIDFKDKDLTLFEAKLDEIILKELYSLKKYENLIKLIATVAPLMGLLGTVTGMIETFNAITIFGTSDPKLMAGGISQALITTVLGLCVAIPMLFLYTFVSSKSNKIAGILDQQSAALIVKSSKDD